MAPTLPLKVTNVREFTAIDAAGKSYAGIQVTYYVGDHGPFTKQFTKQGYTAAAARAELEKDAKEIRATAY